MNPWDIVILAAIAAAVFLAIRSTNTKKKKHTGCGGCCAFCAGCSAGNKEDTKS